jgi:hypothetical protein
MFHGIVGTVNGWVRILTDTELPSTVEVLEEFDGGPYRPAFLEHFFPGRFRVTVRRLQLRSYMGRPSEAPYVGGTVDNEAIRWSNASYQYMVRVMGSDGWLSAFEEIGLQIGNSKKMAKRLIESVRVTPMWLHRDADHPLAVETIKHSYPECYVDGISAISQSLAINCVLSNTTATEEWRNRQILDIVTGKTACVSFRALTPEGEIKGNALILPDSMMNGYDIRTFDPNIKPEIRTSGWQWVTIEPTYGAIPVKSDDLTHAIYRGVDGLYDDATLLSALDGMLESSFEDMKSGKWMQWATTLMDAEDSILHDRDELTKYATEHGLIGRIRVAVAEMDALGIPISASQTLMFLMVGSIRNMALGQSGIGKVWTDKSKHWFPVPWAYAAHIYTQEVLELFGFKMPKTSKGIYHKATHSFVVPGKFFQENLANHGGPDLDDTVKVHIRNFVYPDGSTKKMAFLLRNPNDFGEYSMIPVRDDGPVFHRYTSDPPTVDYSQLREMVPQFTQFSGSLQIGSLPCMLNPTKLDTTFSLKDETRVRQAAVAFPAGVGGTVIPKMMWYATLHSPIPTLCAPNEDIIDALQQGQATSADVKVIQEWIDNTFEDLGRHLNLTMDAFWYTTRMPKVVSKKGGWLRGHEDDSSWIPLHLEREDRVRESLRVMTDWLNRNIAMPQVLEGLTWEPGEKVDITTRLSALIGIREGQSQASWNKYFSNRLMVSDEMYGEEYTNRIVLRYMYTSIAMKMQSPGRNYDQWLYSFTGDSGPQPYQWAVRALRALQSSE